MFAVLPEILHVPGLWQISLQEFIGPSATTIETMWVLMRGGYMGLHATHTGDGFTIGTGHRFTMGLFCALVKANKTVHLNTL